MGINWGLALGQAAKSGLDTFTTLQEEQRKAEEAERRKQEFEWKAQEQKDIQAVKDLNAQTLGNVGNQDYTQAIKTEGGAGDQQAKMLAEQTRGMGAEDEKAAALSTTNALRANAGQAEIAPEVLKGTTYTEKQALADFKSGLAKAKIDPLKAAQITSALRTEQRANEEDAFSERMQERYKQIKTDPVKFVEDNLSIYNDAKTGHFGDGNTAKLIKAEDGSASLEVRNKDGKIVTTQPVNQATALEALKELAFHEYGMMAGKFKEGAELGFRKDEVGIKREEVNVKKDRAKAENAKDYAAAGYYTAHSNVIMDEAKLKRDIQETRDFYGKQIAALPANDNRRYELAQQAEAAVAMKSGDFSKIAANTPMGRTLNQFDVAMKAYHEGKTDKKPDLNVMLDSAGFAPPLIVQAVQGDKDALKALNKGKPFTEAEIKQIKNKYKHTDFGTSAPASSAIPPASPAATNPPAAPAAIPTGNKSGWEPVSESNWANNIKAGRVSTLEKEIADATNPRAKLKLQSELTALRNSMPQ